MIKKTSSGYSWKIKFCPTQCQKQWNTHYCQVITIYSRAIWNPCLYHDGLIYWTTGYLQWVTWLGQKTCLSTVIWQTPETSWHTVRLWFPTNFTQLFWYEYPHIKIWPMKWRHEITWRHRKTLCRHVTSPNDVIRAKLI